MPTDQAEGTTPEDPVGRALELLRANGARITTSRRVLLRCLFEHPGHPSAEELAKAVQATVPDVHLSTIYRNLDELERLGVIEHVHLGHGAATYHLATEQHGHLVCERCGATVEAPDAFFSDLARIARERAGFAIRPHHFAVIGLCQSCAQSAT